MNQSIWVKFAFIHNTGRNAVYIRELQAVARVHQTAAILEKLT